MTPLPALFASLIAIAATDIPFGDHGIAVTIPDWEYSEISVSHYMQNTENLDLTIFTRNLSNRADQSEGILLRFSPTIKTYKDHIGGRLTLKRRIERSPSNAPYQTWSFDPEPKAEGSVKHPFDIEPMLTRLGITPKLKHEFFLTDGFWHSYQAYFETSRGVYAIYIWDANSKPTENPRIKKAFSLIRLTDE